MDLLAHAAYGATLFSRTGLAGGRKGCRRAWFRDWTLWCAAAFGILPDVLSMGLPFLVFVQSGAHSNFFHDLGGRDIVVYRIMHSLLIALLVAGIARLAWKPLFVPSFAWPLHVVMDALTHGSGKFATTIFYPLSDWSLEGVRWWQHPELVAAYWLALPAIWLGLWVLRRKRGPAAA